MFKQERPLQLSKIL